MPDNFGSRLTMLEDCRPSNPAPGSRRIVSLAGRTRFTMLAPSEPIREDQHVPPQIALKKLVHDLVSLLGGLPKAEALRMREEFGKLVSAQLDKN